MKSRHAIYLVLGLLIAPIGMSCEDEKSVRWLSWPVTAQPFQSMGAGALLPPSEERFTIDTQRDVRIGLRADGVVVWEYLDQQETVNRPPPATLKAIPNQ